MLHYLINTTQIVDRSGSAQKFLPGTGIDDASDQRYGMIVAAGGVFWPASSPEVALAAARCSRARKVGADELELETIMQAALNSLGSDGVWSGGNSMAWTQPDWYIDPAGAPDNTGLAGSPISHAEYKRRTGAARDALIGVTMHEIADNTEADPLIQTVNVGPAGFFDVVGENLTVLHSGTIGVYRAPNAGTRTPPGIMDAGGNPLSAYVNKYVRMTSGPFAALNAKFQIAKDEGAGQARTTFPKYRATKANFGYFGLTSFSPSPGDGYEIYASRKVAIALQINSLSPALEFACNLENLLLPGGSITGEKSAYEAGSKNVNHWWCSFPLLAAIETETNFSGCDFSGVVGALGIMQAYDCFWHNPIDCAVAILITGGDTLVQGAARPRFHYPNNAAFYCDSPSGNLAIFDQPGTWLIADHGGIIQLRCALWGENNTGMAVDVGTGDLINNLASFNFRSTSNANGAYGPGAYDFRVNGKTSLPYIDPATNAFSAPGSERVLTYANLVAAVGAGGFGGAARDPISGWSIR